MKLFKNLFGDDLFNLDPDFSLGRTFIYDLEVQLPKIKETIENERLLIGGDFDNFAMRPREFVANWILCAVFNEHDRSGHAFIEDEDSDGEIISLKNKKVVKTEHVSALNYVNAPKQLPSGEDRLLVQINKKIEKDIKSLKKGEDYASGKILVVFSDGMGSWQRNLLRQKINWGDFRFQKLVIIGLISTKPNYRYSLTDVFPDSSATFIVSISEKFDSYKVQHLLG